MKKQARPPRLASVGSSLLITGAADTRQGECNKAVGLLWSPDTLFVRVRLAVSIVQLDAELSIAGERKWMEFRTGCCRKWMRW